MPVIFSRSHGIAVLVGLLTASSAYAGYTFRMPLAPGATSSAPAGSLVLSSLNVDFGSVAMLTSATEVVTLTNNAATAAVVAVVEPSAPFSLVHDCPSSLAPSAACTLTFSFAPTTAGSATGSAIVAGQTLALGGFGDALQVAQLAAGGASTVALKTDGSLWAVGGNGYGQLGDGTQVAKSHFVQMLQADGTPMTGVSRVAAGTYHNVALKNDGTLWAVGYNGSGQLGNGSTTGSPRFVQMLQADGSPITNVTNMDASTQHTLAVSNGGAWGVGLNGSGQLADGSLTNRLRFVQMTSTIGGTAITNVAEVAAGGNHSLVRTTAGTAWAAGYNAAGMLGDGTLTNKNRLVAMTLNGSGAAITGATDIAAGAAHSLVLTSTGTVWATGSNWYGQLGDGTVINKNRLVSMLQSDGSAITAVSGIAAGVAGDYAVALKSNGTAWAVGANDLGQLGDGTTTHRSRFTQMGVADGSAITNVYSISTGAAHSALLQSDGTPWAVGFNSSGQLGDGTTTNRSRLAPMLP